MISASHHVGRLMEVRFVPPVADADFALYTRERRELAARIRPERVVCVDMRRADVFTPEQADLLSTTRAAMSVPLRTAMLVSPERAVFALQIERITRESREPRRRVFRDRAALTAWLDEVLAPAERARLREFLDEQ